MKCPDRPIPTAPPKLPGLSAADDRLQLTIHGLVPKTKLRESSQGCAVTTDGRTPEAKP